MIYKASLIIKDSPVLLQIKEVYVNQTTCVRHVTGNDQDYLGESPERVFRYLRFSKRATVGVRATYATR